MVGPGGAGRGGLLFAAVLATQAELWRQMGRNDAQVAGIGVQVSHIEQMVQNR